MRSLIWKKRLAVGLIAPVGIFLATMATPTLSFAAGPVGLAKDLSSAVSRIIEGSRVTAPSASVVFCMQQPSQCQDTGGADTVELDAGRKAELMKVNTSFNHSIRPQNDPDGMDIWSVDVAAGDCEDYALTKRKHLLALGWSSRALRIAVALTSSGEGHAVLIVKTSQGDFVLDNRTDRIKDWRATGLRWVKMQMQNNPMQWVSLQPASPDPMLVSQLYRAPLTAQINPVKPARMRNRETINTRGFALRRDGQY